MGKRRREAFDFLGGEVGGQLLLSLVVASAHGNEKRQGESTHI